MFTSITSNWALFSHVFYSIPSRIPVGPKRGLNQLSRYFPSSSIELYIHIFWRAHFIDVCGELTMGFFVELWQTRSDHRKFIGTVSFFRFYKRCVGTIPCHLNKTQDNNSNSNKSFSPFVCRSIGSSVGHSVSPSVRRSVLQSASLSVPQSVHPSVHLSVS